MCCKLEEFRYCHSGTTLRMCKCSRVPSGHIAEAGNRTDDRVHEHLVLLAETSIQPFGRIAKRHADSFFHWPARLCLRLSPTSPPAFICGTAFSDRSGRRARKTRKKPRLGKQVTNPDHPRPRSRC